MFRAEQEIINDFVRRYVDRSFRVYWNKMSFELKNGFAHDQAVFRCCRALHLLGVPFATEVRLRCGNVADIVCPTHIKPLIEVLASETDFSLSKKLLRLPEELRGEVLLLRAVVVNKLSPEEIDEAVFIR